MKKVFYVFGNPLVKKDSLALKVYKKLEKIFPEIEFKEFDTMDDLKPEGTLYILDVAEGIKKIELINDLDSIQTDKVYSMHDYDLSYELKLLKKIGKIKDVMIFCIPAKMGEGEAVEKLGRIIKSTLTSRSD
jgi:Ni,Fe-hydrogenase maturation factor